MATVITILVIVAMISIAVRLIQMANARNTVLPAATRPIRHGHLPWRGTTPEHQHRHP